MSDLSGGLAFDVDEQGIAALQITNLHGDIVTTATLGQAGITHYTETDEYGRVSADSTGSAPRYGWLGTHQRDAATLGGLVLMGARLYATAIGRFLSVDAVLGGNQNRYVYPADPVNSDDISGNCSILGGGGEEDCAHALERGRRQLAACKSSCSLVGVISDLAMSLVPGNSNKANAVRHFIWQVTLAVFVGPKMTKAIGDAHDWDLLRFKKVAADSRRDLANNKIALRWHSLRAPQLRSRMRSFYQGSGSEYKAIRKFMKYLVKVGNKIYKAGGFVRI